MKNSDTIDGPDYYRLPDGSQLEDAIAYFGLNFAMGSALKYLWRAGRKDGESRGKDLAKATHFIRFEAGRAHGDEGELRGRLERYVKTIEERSAEIAKTGGETPWRRGR